MMRASRTQMMKTMRINMVNITSLRFNSIVFSKVAKLETCSRQKRMKIEYKYKEAILHTYRINKNKNEPIRSM